MGKLRDFLPALNRIGRGVGGSAAYPEPPGLNVPPEIRLHVDGDEIRADERSEN